MERLSVFLRHFEGVRIDGKSLIAYTVASVDEARHAEVTEDLVAERFVVVFEDAGKDMFIVVRVGADADAEVLDAVFAMAADNLDQVGKEADCAGVGAKSYDEIIEVVENLVELIPELRGIDGVRKSDYFAVVGQVAGGRDTKYVASPDMLHSVVGQIAFEWAFFAVGSDESAEFVEEVENVLPCGSEADDHGSECRGHYAVVMRDEVDRVVSVLAKQRIVLLLRDVLLMSCQDFVRTYRLAVFKGFFEADDRQIGSVEYDKIIALGAEYLCLEEVLARA